MNPKGGLYGLHLTFLFDDDPFRINLRPLSEALDSVADTERAA